MTNRPPISSTRFLAMESPRPLPSVLLDKPLGKLFRINVERLPGNILQGESDFAFLYPHVRIYTAPRKGVFDNIAIKVLHNPPQGPPVSPDINPLLGHTAHSLQTAAFELLKEFPLHLLLELLIVHLLGLDMEIAGVDLGYFDQILHKYFQTLGLFVQHIHILFNLGVHSLLPL